MTVLAGWEGGLSGVSGLSHPAFCMSVVYPRSSSQQIPNQHLPAIHRPYINRGDREQSAGCFAFSPLCRGVSHQLAFDRPGREKRATRSTRGSRRQQQERIVDSSHDGLTD